VACYFKSSEVVTQPVGGEVNIARGIITHPLFWSMLDAIIQHMEILETTGWDDYELIDSGGGKRLERFGKYTLVRPDPQAIWESKADAKLWEDADAKFTEKWQNKNVPDSWNIKYKHLTFKLKLTPFKHTGIFPEQVVNWEFIEKKAKGLNILNLFGYTGAASLVAAKAGAKVTHVDASRPAITWLKENEELSGLLGQVRVIADDALKFVEREIKRGNKYDAIIMDPPVYGHSPDGSVWDFNKKFPDLIEKCSKILSDNPKFIIVNAYALSSSSLMLKSVMEDFLPKGGIEVGEICLKEKTAGRLLSTGIFARWQKK